LTFEGLVEIFVRDENQGVQQKIHEYILSQMRLQGVDNPAGSLRDGSGLGEAKFTVDLRAFTENWGTSEWQIVSCLSEKCTDAIQVDPNETVRL
jgi:hypothetical protein